MSHIGFQIKQRREELGMTQEELAKKLGYKSKSTINKIEAGINDIVQSKVIAFAEALDTTPSYLMGWEDNDEANKADNELIAQNETERRLLVMCRKVDNSSPEEKEDVINLLESTIDLYLKARGLKK